MSNKTPPLVSLGNGEPVVPSHIYAIKVWRVDNDGDTWIEELYEKTSAQSPHGAMRGIVEADTAKKMLQNKRAIDAED